MSVTKQVDELAHLPLREVDSWGTVNAVFRLGDELVVRVPILPGGGAGNERDWLGALAPVLPVAVPKVIGRGRGFHVRTSRRTWFDVGTSAPDRLVVEVALGDDATVDVGVYEGGPVAVLRAFLDEVGRAKELPPWVFRLWASGNEWNTQDLVLARMDALRDTGIPVGAVVIEAWSDEEGITISATPATT